MGASAGVPGSASLATLPADRPLPEPRVLTGGLGGDGLRAALGLGRGDRAGSPRGHAPPTGSRGCPARAGPEAAEEGEEASPERCPAAGRSHSALRPPKLCPGHPPLGRQLSGQKPSHATCPGPASFPTPHSVQLYSTYPRSCWCVLHGREFANRPPQEQLRGQAAGSRASVPPRERAQQRLEVPPPPSGG